MELANMQMSPEAAKEYAGGIAADPGNAPKYPYGLCICLNDDSLKKLGISDLPAVGGTFMVMAQVTVSSVRSSQQQDGDKERSVDLQITDMALEAPPKEINAQALYPNSGHGA